MFIITKTFTDDDGHTRYGEMTGKDNAICEE